MYVVLNQSWCCCSTVVPTLKHTFRLQSDFVCRNNYWIIIQILLFLSGLNFRLKYFFEDLRTPFSFFFFFLTFQVSQPHVTTVRVKSLNNRILTIICQSCFSFVPLSSTDTTAIYWKLFPDFQKQLPIDSCTNHCTQTPNIPLWICTSHWPSKGTRHEVQTAALQNINQAS
jgi:hypothetical protein